MITDLSRSKKDIGAIILPNETVVLRKQIAVSPGSYQILRW